MKISLILFVENDLMLIKLEKGLIFENNMEFLFIHVNIKEINQYKQIN